MTPDRILSMLGLARKAGKIQAGGFLTERAVKSGRAACVITARDASENTRKEFSDMCSYYKVPFYMFSDKEELGHTIGCEDRVVLAVTDEGFARQIETKLQELPPELLKPAPLIHKPERKPEPVMEHPERKPEPAMEHPVRDPKSAEKYSRREVNGVHDRLQTKPKFQKSMNAGKTEEDIHMSEDFQSERKKTSRTETRRNQHDSRKPLSGRAASEHRSERPLAGRTASEHRSGRPFTAEKTRSEYGSGESLKRERTKSWQNSEKTSDTEREHPVHKSRTGYSSERAGGYRSAAFRPADSHGNTVKRSVRKNGLEHRVSSDPGKRQSGRNDQRKSEHREQQ